MAAASGFLMVPLTVVKELVNAPILDVALPVTNKFQGGWRFCIAIFTNTVDITPHRVDKQSTSLSWSASDSKIVTLAPPNRHL